MTRDVAMMPNTIDTHCTPVGIMLISSTVHVPNLSAESLSHRIIWPATYELHWKLERVRMIMRVEVEQNGSRG